MQPAMIRRLRGQSAVTIMSCAAMVAVLSGCLGRGMSAPSISHGAHRSSPSHEAANARAISWHSAIVMANVAAIWRRIDDDKAADHAQWLFRFQARCPRERDADHLLQAAADTFVSSVTTAKAGDAWLVQASSPVRQVAMDQGRLMDWVESAARLSDASGCQLSAWEIRDVVADRTYRSESSSV